MSRGVADAVEDGAPGVGLVLGLAPDLLGRLRRAGEDGVDGDAAGAELARQRLHVRGGGGLAAGVGGEPLRLPPDHRGRDRHDAAPVHDAARGRLQDDERPPRVDAEVPVEDVQVRLGEGVRLPLRAGVVDDDVEPAQKGLGLVEELGDLPLIADVRLDRLRLSARRLDGLHHCLSGLVVAVVADGEAGAVAGQPLGDAPADVARSAGDEGVLLGERAVGHWGAGVGWKKKRLR